MIRENTVGKATEDVTTKRQRINTPHKKGDNQKTQSTNGFQKHKKHVCSAQNR